MNILEAAQSGRRFKRRHWKKQWVDYKSQGLSPRLSIEDLRAVDWEVEETAATITRSQFEAAWKRVILFDAPQVKELLAKELGL